MSPIAQKIQERFPDAFVSSKEALGELTVTVRREKIVDVCRFLHDDPALDFDHISDICSVDYPNEEPRFEVVYHFYSIEKNHRIRVKARVPEDDCAIDSVTGVWRGANFLEREVYDMMGIVFNNHPDLRRILMTEEYDEGFPLRKDFPVEGRGWRDRFEFLGEGK
ncbi:MAG TPA: NADH-quinone oxidoreductase subunit C [Candidatus Manganitrophaceae bacterium]|nr:NADH-quinone oxidoreductase subunit C [Candidatus Manganitrophaceae bacterium]